MHLTKKIKCLDTCKVFAKTYASKNTIKNVLYVRLKDFVKIDAKVPFFISPHLKIIVNFMVCIYLVNLGKHFEFALSNYFDDFKKRNSHDKLSVDPSKNF